MLAVRYEAGPLVTQFPVKPFLGPDKLKAERLCERLNRAYGEWEESVA